MAEISIGPRLTSELLDRVWATAARTGDHASAAHRLEELAATGREGDVSRAEVLLDAGNHWLNAGRPEEALRCYQRARGEGDDALVDPRPFMVGALFATGRDGEAHAILAELDAERPDDPETCLLTGTALEQHGDFKAALRWYARGMERQLRDLGLDTGEPGLDLDDVDPDPVFIELLIARARTRGELGLVPDEYDEFAVFVAEELLKDELDEDEPATRRASLVLLYWPEHEYQELRHRWPDVAESYGDDHAEHRRNIERSLRGYAEQGARVRVAPGSVAGLEAYAAEQDGSVTDGTTRAGYAAAVAQREGAIAWPPERNAPCWCGSGAKYKKCCGHPANR
ncbi:hypothetical protein C3Y87_20055 [Carbonactinospora thermoautotrophica]|uniref:SEC-C metal-binding domain-containing protein n=1 Tax=Carbonactinospora thermoautotrophica TaxID=1469144 RepID=UPI002271DDD6|nr:SEC-C metal-binding domain-containing protein [Carbonactinospora thermoautotrophica]MCX9193635.1 hypothetical protein [Carbonactinospora thermoautotrophica]